MRHKASHTPHPHPPALTVSLSPHHRGSTFGPPSTTTATRRDPRPVTDRAFVADAAVRVTSYLQEAGYTASHLTPRTLAAPTTKDFAAITLFLLRRLDPATPDFTRLDEDVASAFRRLRYPFPISKTSLCSVGAPATWPPLLAALAWLADLARYADGAREAVATPVDDDALHRAAFNAFVASSYRAYMEGDDDGRAAVEADTAAAWAEKEGDAAARADALAAECSALRARLAALASEPAPMAAAQAAADAAVADRASFQKLLAQLDAHAASLERDAREAAADEAAAHASRAAAEEEAAMLKARLTAQTVSTADAERMRGDAARLAGERDAAVADGAEADAHAEALETDLASAMDALEAGPLADYNAAATRCALVPSTAKRAAGRAHAATLDRAARADAVAIIGVDVKATVRSIVDRARERAVSRCRELATEAAALTARMESTSSSAAARARERAALRANVEAAEARCEAIQAEADAGLAALREEAERVKAGGGGGGASSSVSLTTSDAAVAATEAAAAAEAAAREADEADLADALAGALEAALAHKQAVQDAVERAVGGVAAAREAVGRVPGVVGVE